MTAAIQWSNQKQQGLTRWVDAFYQGTQALESFDLSISTIQKWELGDKKPSDPSLKLLSLLERKGLEAVI